MPDAPTRRDREDPVLVWDLPLRLFHGLLTVAVLVSFASHWLGPRAFAVHVASASVVLVLVAFRTGWGFAGSRYARFGAFVRGPRAVLAYLRADPAGASPELAID
jgi:cytochrome b